MRHFWKRLLVTGPALLLASMVVLVSQTAHATTIFVNADGTPTDNGFALHRTIQAVRNAASADNRYLIQLDAGTYEISNMQLSISPYIDLQGAGINATQISADGPLSFTLSGGSRVRDLTYLNRGSSTLAYVAFSVSQQPDQPASRITNVAIRFPNLPRYTIGVDVRNAETILHNVSFESNAYQVAIGVRVDNDLYPDRRVIIDQVTASDSAPNGYGLVNLVGSIVARNSVIRGSYQAVRNVSTSGTAALVASEIDGAVYSGTVGGVVCIGSYDASYAVLPADCGATP